MNSAKFWPTQPKGPISMLGGESFSLPVRPHASGLWVGIDVMIGGGLAYLAILDIGSPLSAISPGLSQDLQDQGILRPAADSRSYQLLDLTADGHRLPDLTVRI